MSQNTATSSSFRPSWLNTAREYLGTKEIPGYRNNTNVINFLKSTDLQNQEPTLILRDEIPWCAAFVTYCLSQTTTRILPAKSASVEAWSTYGDVISINNIKPGDMLFWPNHSHIGFATSTPKNGKISVISGNYGPTGKGEVKEVTLPLSTFTQARRPPPGYPATTGPQLTSDAAPPLTLAATATTGSDTTPNKNSNNKSHGSQIPPSVLDNLTGVPASTPVSSPSLTTRNVLQLASALSSFQLDRLSDRSSSSSSPQPSENNSSVFNLASS